MPCVYVNQLGKDIESKMAACRQFAAGTYLKGIWPGGGFFTLPNTILHEGTRQQAEFLNELQRIATGETRLKIPLLMTEEGTHGLMCSGGTIFPEGLALGSTWNPELLEEIYTVVAREASSIGVHQVFTLVVEPNRDPRLGRNQEGFGEDPYLCSRVAESIVRGVQGEGISARDRVVAGLCHYPGQSQPVSGLERGAIEYSERVFREAFLPPWEAGIKKCGALGVMATYPSVLGIPVHASPYILTTILRDELGFDGLVLSEGGGISTLVYEGLAPSQKEAGELALKSGVDVGISYEPAYMLAMIENVREGKVSMDLIDRAVGRILTTKFRKGLFENPFVDPEHAVKTVHREDHVQLALRAAHEGIVLLKNEGGLLPLDKNVRSIAVIGPNADHVRNQLGDYVAWNILQDVTTILGGIRSKVSPGTKVVHVRGCNVFNTDLNEIDKARDAAKNADVAVVVVGENAWRNEDDQITDGEGYDVASLDLTGLQEDLIRAVYETGTPTVVVLVNGRPLSIRWTAEHVPAIVEAWLIGEQGGHAVADILFEYSNLSISPEKINRDGKVRVTVDIKNTGKMEGMEVVQLYINDSIATVATPVKLLKGFEKISLAPGEKKTVEFSLTSEHLSLYDREMKRVVEPGMFEVQIGHSSRDIRLKGNFEVVE